MSYDQSARPGLLPRGLAWITRLAIARPIAWLLLILASCLACLGWSAVHLTFKTDRSDLIDHRAEFHQRWLKFAKEFGESSDVIVVVESASPEAIRKALDDIGQRIEQEPESFSRVQWKFDPGVLRSKGLQYLPPALLEQAVSQLKDYSPILKSGRWNVIGLESIGDRISLHIQDSMKRGDSLATQRGVEHAARLAQSLAGFVEDPLSFTSPWPEVIPATAGGELAQMKIHYNLNAKETMGFVLAVPSKSTTDFSGGSPAIKRLRTIVQESQEVHPDVRLGLTGIPILEADEMAKSQEDMTLASSISFVGVAILLVAGFRGIRQPLAALIMLLVGICWSIGFTTIVIGHLNILSVSFATILVGLGIDFAVHFLERYLDLRHQGRPLREALIQTSETTGSGIATCAVTTSLAFFCAGFTSFLGVAELGIIAGGGVLLCAVAAITVLPPLVCLTDRQRHEAQLPHAFQGTALRFVTYRFPWTVVVLTLIAFIVITSMGFGRLNGKVVSRVRYDSNLLNLQARGVESVELQHRIFEQSDGSLLYAVSIADSPRQIRELRSRFLALPTVGRVEELASLLPVYSADETLVYVVQMQEMLSKIQPPPQQSETVDFARISQSFERLFALLESIPDPRALQASESLDLFLNTLSAIPAPERTQLLSGYQHAAQIALHTQFQMLAQVTDTRPILDAIPEALRSRFISPEGNWMLRIFPRQQIWEEEPLGQFVRDIRSIDPEATGTPLQNFEAARQIRESYQHAAILASAMVLFVLLVDLLRIGPLLVSMLAPLIVVGFAMRTPAVISYLGVVGTASLYIVLVFVIAAIFDTHNIGKAILAMLPPLGGGLLTFGMLAILKTNLNPANMIVLPLLLGIGVDSGVYVVHDYRSQSPGTYKISSSIINAILLTSLTTMVGFGSMIVSSHQGLSSLGLVLTVGVGSCLFVSLVPLPAFLTLLDRTRAKAVQAPGIDPANLDIPSPAAG